MVPVVELPAESDSAVEQLLPLPVAEQRSSTPQVPSGMVTPEPPWLFESVEEVTLDNFKISRFPRRGDWVPEPGPGFKKHPAVWALLSDALLATEWDDRFNDIDNLVGKSFWLLPDNVKALYQPVMADDDSEILFQLREFPNASVPVEPSVEEGSLDLEALAASLFA